MKISDFHTHILPSVDDGSTGVEISLEMLRFEASQGVEKVALTPHFYPGNERPEIFLERRKKALCMLEEALSKTDETFPRLLVGAEVGYFEGISDCEYLSQLALTDTGTIMIEMPLTKWSKRMLSELSEIHQKQGLTPIIAHIDRYIGGFHSCVNVEELYELPVLIQASADFFISRRTRKKAIGMLRKGCIHLLGSDAHNMISRKPNVSEAVEIIRRSLGDEAIAYIRAIEDDIFSENT